MKKSLGVLVVYSLNHNCNVAAKENLTLAMLNKT